MAAPAAADAPRRRFCPRCHWRHDVLPPQKGEEAGSPSSSYHEEEEYHRETRGRILGGLHMDIPAPWVSILETRLLHSGNIIEPHAPVLARPEFITQAWLRFELRSSCVFIFPRRVGPRHFQVDGETYSPWELCYEVFHNTQLANLITESACAPGSQGILMQGLCFGVCTHNHNSGVNYYSSAGEYGFWTFKPESPGFVALELVVNAGTKLTGGSPGRYCINRANCGDGEVPLVCPFAGIKAIWLPWTEAPDFLKLS